jgi:hypothetical protein
MSKSSAWQLLEKSLRRLVRFRVISAPDEVIKKETDLARRWWAQVPLSPAGVWPEDILAVAKELGFEPDTRGPGLTDPAIAAGIAQASELYRLVAMIEREIRSAGGIKNLAVTAAGHRITLIGTGDASASERAFTIAARVAPTFEIESRITAQP